MLRLIYWFRPYALYAFLLWMVTIITVSSIPSLPTLKIHTEKSEFRLDYIIHFCEYGMLGFFGLLAGAGKEYSPTLKKLLLITSGLILFAVLDELHQKIIPGRAFNLKDVYSDIAGIIAALGFCLMVFRILRRKQTFF